MLLGARIGCWSGGKLSAKSYVQDDLIAMYDGIENAGWGVHAESPSTWKDLIGTIGDLTVVDASKWGDNYGGSAYSIAKLSNLSNNLTLQFVFSWTSVSSNGLTGALGFVDGYIGFWPNSSNVYKIVIRHGNKYETNELIKTLSLNTNYLCTITLEDNDVVTVYIGGNTVQASGMSVVSASTFNIFRYSTWSGGGRMYNARVYDKVLSPSEIAANYRVDKARFGLT